MTWDLYLGGYTMWAIIIVTSQVWGWQGRRFSKQGQYAAAVEASHLALTFSRATFFALAVPIGVALNSIVVLISR